MAQYEHLPIYKQALDLAVYLEKVVSGFSRYHKYSLGADLRKIARHNITLIVRANSEIERSATLLVLRYSLEELMVCLRIAKDCYFKLAGFMNFTPSWIVSCANY